MRTTLTILALVLLFAQPVLSKHHYTFQSLLTLNLTQVKEVQFILEKQLQNGDACTFVEKSKCFEVTSEDPLEVEKLKNSINKAGYFFHVIQNTNPEAVLLNKNSEGLSEDQKLRQRWFELHHMALDLELDAAVEILTEEEFNALHPQKRAKIQEIKTIVILP
jgi:hypothetical protein